MRPINCFPYMDASIWGMEQVESLYRTAIGTETKGLELCKYSAISSYGLQIL